MGELEGVGGYGMVGLNGTGSCDFWGKVEVGNGQTRHEMREMEGNWGHCVFVSLCKFSVVFLLIVGIVSFHYFLMRGEGYDVVVSRK